MPKKAGRPKTSDRDDLTVRVDRRLVNKAKLLASHRGISVAELLSGMLEDPIESAYGEMVREFDDRKR